MTSPVTDEQLPPVVLQYRLAVEDAIAGEGVTDYAKTQIDSKFLDINDYACTQRDPALFAGVCILMLREMVAERLTTLSGSIDPRFHLCDVSFTIANSVDGLPLDFFVRELGQAVKHRCVSRRLTPERAKSYTVELFADCSENPTHALEHVACLNWLIAFIHAGRVSIMG